MLSKTDKIAASDRPKVLHIADGKNLLKVDGTNTIIDEWIRVFRWAKCSAKSWKYA